MKSKIGLLAIVLFSGLMLSACTNKNATNTSDDTEEQSQIGARPSGAPDSRGPGQQIDWTAVAEKLGKTEEELKTALGITNETEQLNTTPGVKPNGEPKKMDLAAAAKTLGVTEDALKEALGMNNIPSGQPQGGDRPEGSPPAIKN